DVSTGSYLPKIVDTGQLAEKNGIISGSHAIASLAGPSVAGAIMQVAGAFCTLLIDALSYLVAFLIQRGLPDRTIEGGSDAIFKQLSNGFRSVFGERVLARTTVAAAGINLACGGLMVLGPWLTIRTFGLSLAASGLVLSAQALGASVGSFMSHRISATIGIERGITAATLITCLGYVLIAIASVHGPGAVCIFTSAGFIFQAGVAVFSVLARTHRQTICDSKTLPLVLSTVRFISWGAIPVGSLVTGYLASSNAAMATVLIGGGVSLAALCVGRLSPCASPAATVK
ncbi:MAG: MFS transporter, partial [[Mycobacterium] stephanolepidis]